MKRSMPCVGSNFGPAAIATALFLTGCVTGGSSVSELDVAALSSPACQSPDNVTRVRGGDECLVLKTAASKSNSESPVVVVFIHPNFCTATVKRVESRIWYLHEVGLQFQEMASANGRDDVVIVSILRPGYGDSEGNRSTGNHGGPSRPFCDNNTEANVAAVAEALKTIKKHHTARGLIAFGHSDGGNYVGIILGKHPGIIDAAVPAGAPVDLPRWQANWRAKSIWTQSLSAHDYVDGVPVKTLVIAVEGANDKNVPPHIPGGWIKMLQERGVNARMDLFEGVNHRETPYQSGTLKALFEAVSSI